MTALQFGTFTWPNNPETFRIVYARDLDIEGDDEGRWSVTNHGRLGRVFLCEGVFHGSTAYSSSIALSNLFLTGGTGTLKHPCWASVTALMTDLEIIEEPGENLVRYKIKFLEMP